MSPPSPTVVAAGWNGLNDTIAMVSRIVAIAVAMPLRENAAVIGAASVLLGLTVLFIGVSELGQNPAERDMDRIDADRRRARGGQPGQRPERRSSQQRQAFYKHPDISERRAGALLFLDQRGDHAVAQAAGADPVGFDPARW